MVWWLRLLIGFAITAGAAYWYNNNVLNNINQRTEAESEYYDRDDYDYDDDDEEEEEEQEPVFEF